MSQLRGVAVGAGYFSQFHYDAWSRMEAVQMLAVCDLNRSQAEQAAAQYDIPRCYTEFAEMLDAERPDFVDIITRPDSHLTLTLEAAQRGIAVICQKPLAPSIEEARELVEATKRADVPLMVHENFRFQPWHRTIKRLLSEQAIGDKLHTLTFRARMGDGWQPDAYLARQPYFRDMKRFLIHETGVHFIDTFRFLAGEVEGVFAKLRKLNGEIAGEDAGIVLFDFVSGAQGVWDANRFNESNSTDPRYTFGEFLVEGNGGSIRLYPDGRLTLQPLGEEEQEIAYEHRHENFASDCVYHTQRHFVQSLLAGQPFETSGEDYLRTLTVQEAVYESAASGQPVTGLADQ